MSGIPGGDIFLERGGPNSIPQGHPTITISTEYCVAFDLSVPNVTHRESTWLFIEEPVVDSGDGGTPTPFRSLRLSGFHTTLLTDEATVGHKMNRVQI